MSKPVTDWNTVKVEYMAGMSPNELAAKYGLKAPTIKQQALRNKWVAQKREVQAHFEKVTSIQVYQNSKGLVDRANAVLDKMMGDAENSAELLLGEKFSTPTDFDDLEKRERVAGLLVKRVRDTGGLDDVKAAGLVVIGQFTRFEDEPQVKAIDVVSETSTGEQAKE